MNSLLVRQEGEERLACLLLPLADRQLLLPNVAIAELISFRAPQPVADLPSWFLGWICWRDLQLPLLSFEEVSAGQVRFVCANRIAVLNALGGREQLKFIALLIQGIPRSVRVDSDLAAIGAKLAPFELEVVSLGDEQASIPDLAGLEQLLVDLELV
ncbi:chemotaxis protein CheW [Azomonas macrocytogenes]|uniref:Chemosensory pili system protein ChpC n=1 Tax=Azomonas macrocytogenes TaxID=69962 RepID=A0A839T6G3_AZOMA|nr:chemotaxis protein CheW [Azomonas macrocytogenes]MBB3103874.1 chemosensory pili system protein ChpC [Azomonas macrocytogenes]